MSEQVSPDVNPTLLVHGFHTDCSECGNDKLSPSSTSCDKCGAVFTRVETRCLYKLGRDELSMAIGEWQDKGASI